MNENEKGGALPRTPPGEAGQPAAAGEGLQPSGAGQEPAGLATPAASLVRDPEKFAYRTIVEEGLSRSAVSLSAMWLNTFPEGQAPGKHYHKMQLALQRLRRKGSIAYSQDYCRWSAAKEKKTLSESADARAQKVLYDRLVKKFGAPGPNGIDVALIRPDLHPKFSPNLFLYLTSRKMEHDAKLVRVYGSPQWQSQLILGIIDTLPRTDWSFGVRGCRLMAALSSPRKRENAHFMGQDFQEVEGFWERYVSIGRCALDEEHRTSFIGDDGRWSKEGKNRRRCTWCGMVQKIIKRRVSKTHISYKNEGRPT